MKRTTPTDLDQYLPDEAAEAEIMAGPTEGNKVDPELIEKLRRLGTNPEIMRVAPPSVTEYVAPTALPGAGSGERTAKRAEARVEVAVPLKETDFPTMPSLKRLHGEPEVPGVVRGPSAVAPSEDQGETREGSRTKGRAAALIVAAVLLPMILVIIFRGRTTPQPGADSGTGSATATPVLSAAPIAPTAPSVPVRAIPSTEPTAPVPVAPASVAAPPAAAPTFKPAGRALKLTPRDSTAAPTAAAPPPTAVPVAPPAVTSAPALPLPGPPPAPQPPPIPKIID